MAFSYPRRYTCCRFSPEAGAAAGGVAASVTTARAHRKHIGLFGPRNSGKSSLLNALVGQQVAIVNEQAGTTTDVVAKSMELRGVGPVVWLDTAGFDEPEDDALGQSRVAASREAAKRCDLVLLVLDAATLFEAGRRGLDEIAALLRPALAWRAWFEEIHTPCLVLLNQVDRLRLPDRSELVQLLRTCFPVLEAEHLYVSTETGEGLEELSEQLRNRLRPAEDKPRLLTAGLVGAGDTVLLIIPQDKQAPKGRLIPAQVETIRELLDLQAICVAVKLEQMEEALDNLVQPPKLLICDSQVFREAHQRARGLPLTSFSILYSAYKGDLSYFLEGAKHLARLGEDAHILIAEACSHQPTNEDIGRVKLPRMLRKKLGEGLHIDVLGSRDFPEDLRGYDLVIHCGACMFNRKLVMSRVEQAKRQLVPMSNYGIAIAALQGILPDVTLPEA